MPADMGGKSPLRDGSNEKSILAEIKQISSLLQFKTCAPALGIDDGSMLGQIEGRELIDMADAGLGHVPGIQQGFIV
jgi:hypothetical protein